MARLLSVNVGLPRDIEWRGKTVHTGIWKQPVQGRRRVRRLNVEGDGQGDPGGHGGEPRVTCYRVGIRMDEPQMAALLTSSGRPGFYLRRVATSTAALRDLEASRRGTLRLFVRAESCKRRGA